LICNSTYIPNNFFAFLVVSIATSSKLTPLNSAIFKATLLTKRGSFLFPRCGMGATYGQSVSIRIFSSGIFFIFLKILGYIRSICCNLSNNRPLNYTLLSSPLYHIHARAYFWCQRFLKSLRQNFRHKLQGRQAP